MAKGRMVIAVCGKGGAGKTTASAAVIRALLAGGQGKVLAIDADPAVGLASALGFEPGRTVDDIRNEIIERIGEGSGRGKRELLADIDYSVMEAVRERGNLAFLAIGRPEREGCYCKVNELLREVIAELAVNFDHVVIDGEAGIEQVNRRVMEKVTHLLLISDVSARGLNVAKSIFEVAGRAMKLDGAGLLLNRVPEGFDTTRLKIPEGLNLLGVINDTPAIRDADVEGKNLLDLNADRFFGDVKKGLERLVLWYLSGSPKN